MLLQIFSAPTWRSKSACCISCEGCSLAPQSSKERPVAWSVSARSRMAPRPVASIAVMFRSLRITMAGNFSRDWRMSENPVDDRVIRNVLSLENVDAAVFDVVFRYGTDSGCSRNFANKHQRGEHHADFHSKRQIGHNGQRQGQQPHRDVRSAELQDFWNLFPIAHVVGDDHQNRS